ncbi:MAG: L,D-transpeptidase family protein, partial [Cyclobacteriaceae bacterium]
REPILTVAHVVTFYQRHNYQPVWIEEDELTIWGKELVATIANASEEGMNPRDYHLAKVNQLVEGIQASTTPLRFLHLEVLLTDAYLTFAAHLYRGKVCAEKVDPEWHADCKQEEIDYSSQLSQALNGKDIIGSLDQLKPQEPAYQQLKAALAHYRSLQIKNKEGFPTIRPKADRVPGYDVLDIDFLEERLIALGDLLKEDVTDAEKVTNAVSQFQHRHGIDTNGMIDSLTINALNVSLEERIKTIETNLERWRWLPLELGGNYILVNIANFSLEVFEGSNIVFQSDVIVGTRYHRTPVFNAQMTHVILKPYWHVPRSIVNNEILTLASPAGYLNRNQIRIIDQSGQAISTDSIDWSQARPGNFPYRLRQEPGTHNSLGLIKFMFPNPYSVYVHDTPTKMLFDRQVRTFSHGCIRLQKPFELADYLLDAFPEWDQASLQEATDSTRYNNHHINLPIPIPVYVLYWTAWMDNEGHIHFRDDVYQRDLAVWQALEHPVEIVL